MTRKSKYVPLALFLTLLTSASIADTSPFVENPKLRDFSERALQAANSQTPILLEVAKVDDNEIEEVYQYLRTQIQRPLNVWQTVLLDYPRLRLLRNEIYARHGLLFTSADLNSYFRSFNWYKPDTDFTEEKLSPMEKENISTLARIEYIKYHQHEQLGEVVKFTKIDNDKSKSADEKAVNVPFLDGEITRSLTGCCGSSSGTTSIINGDGVQFHSSFGAEGIGDGMMEYIVPLWAKNPIAWIIGEIRNNKSNVGPAIYDRIAVLSSSGKPIVDFHLLHGSLTTGVYLDQIGLDQLVLLSSNILYFAAPENGNENKVQYLLYLDRKLSFDPKVEALYRWQPFELTNSKIGCLKDKRSVHSAPVNNPAILWQKEVRVSEIPPVITKQSIIYFVPQSELDDVPAGESKRNNAIKFQIHAINKLTGKQEWSYLVPARVEASSTKNDILAVKYYHGVAVIDINTGKAMWNIAIDEASFQFPFISELLIGDNSLALGSRGFFYDVYSLKTGVLISRKDIRTGLGTISYPSVENILKLDDLLVIALFVNMEQKKEQWRQYHVIIALDATGEVKWRYMMAPDDDFQISGIWLEEENCNVAMVAPKGKRIYLDAATGKKLAESSRKVLVPKISWYLPDLRRIKTGSEPQLNTNRKKLKKKEPEESAEGPCVATSLTGGVVYAWDSVWTSETIALFDACVSAEKDENSSKFRKHYWTFSPWLKNRKQSDQIYHKILFIDNHFILVEISNDQRPKMKRYWAIGEEALKDYSFRKGAKTF